MLIFYRFFAVLIAVSIAVFEETIKKAHGVLRKPVQMRYAFIQDNQHIWPWPIRRLCSTLDVHHSGYYVWLKQPTSKTTKKRQQLFGLIKPFWLESGGVYGYRKIHCDLKYVGESCRINQVYRLMKAMVLNHSGVIVNLELMLVIPLSLLQTL